MAEIKVVAVVDDNEYDLSNTDDTYTDSIVAPSRTTDVEVVATDEVGNVSTESRTLTVDQEWLPPKTDWTTSDYLNAIDYNRIINNLTHLNAMAMRLFNNVSSINMGDEKDYTSLIYAREMNTIEDALEQINADTYKFDIGEKQTYKANGNTPLNTEFNRIESSSLKLFDTMTSHKEALPRLAFRLGGQKGIRV